MWTHHLWSRDLEETFSNNGTEPNISLWYIWYYQYYLIILLYLSIYFVLTFTRVYLGILLSLEIYNSNTYTYTLSFALENHIWHVERRQSRWCASLHNLRIHNRYQLLIQQYLLSLSRIIWFSYYTAMSRALSLSIMKAQQIDVPRHRRCIFRFVHSIICTILAIVYISYRF